MTDREPTVTCDECEWSQRNNGDYDLDGEQCLFHGCRGTLTNSSVVVMKPELRRLYDNLKVPKRERLVS